MHHKEELSATGMRTYVYLVKAGRPVGPREVMRGAKLTSPSVAYRNLQKLIDMDLVQQDKGNDYVVKEKTGLKGYIWVGKTLIPRFMAFGLVFSVALIIEVGILVPHLLTETSVEGSFWLLMVVTVVSAGMFFIEGIRWKKNKPVI